MSNLKVGSRVKHTKYNRCYEVVSLNARLKNSDGNWIDAVVYKPLYPNEFEMFAREKESFIKEFELDE